MLASCTQLLVHSTVLFACKIRFPMQTLLKIMLLLISVLALSCLWMKKMTNHMKSFCKCTQSLALRFHTSRCNKSFMFINYKRFDATRETNIISVLSKQTNAMFTPVILRPERKGQRSPPRLEQESLQATTATCSSSATCV